ncbi:hypothetical protein MXD63_14270 [Frankia sp. Cpl3]|nr:hypothetical protein [Frankia sp. Cpl3]
MTTCTGIAGGHITSTSDPGWCVYCGTAVAPPPWSWATARQTVIMQAAETPP